MRLIPLGDDRLNLRPGVQSALRAAPARETADAPASSPLPDRGLGHASQGGCLVRGDQIVAE